TFTFRLLLLSACLHVMISCKEEVSHSAKAKTAAPAEAEVSTVTQEQAANSAKGIAHFESGLKAAEVENMPLAFEEFLEAAKVGHVYAQYNVGLMYEQGLGIGKDAKEAVHWYKESAIQGNSAAQFNLGVCF